MEQAAAVVNDSQMAVARPILQQSAIVGEVELTGR